MKYRYDVKMVALVTVEGKDGPGLCTTPHIHQLMEDPSHGAIEMDEGNVFVTNGIEGAVIMRKVGNWSADSNRKTVRHEAYLTVEAESVWEASRQCAAILSPSPVRPGTTTFTVESFAYKSTVLD